MHANPIHSRSFTEGSNLLPLRRPTPLRPKPVEESAIPLGLAPAGRLTEISGHGLSARTTLAVSFVIQAQQLGEPVAWVQSEGGNLYPPDLVQAGVCLDDLVVLHVPTVTSSYSAIRSAEWLARSGAFGLIVVDVSEGLPPGSPARWQGRLQVLLRKHNARLCLLTSSADHAASSGPLISVRIAPKRKVFDDLTLGISIDVLKDKVGLPEHPRDFRVASLCGFETGGA